MEEIEAQSRANHRKLIKGMAAVFVGSMLWATNEAVSHIAVALQPVDIIVGGIAIVYGAREAIRSVDE